MNTIKRTRLETFIRRLGSKIFTVHFTKADGRFRVMNCRKGVHKGVKGTGSYSGTGTWTSCIKVFDMKKQAFRQINLATVQTVYADGKEFHVVN